MKIETSENVNLGQSIIVLHGPFLFFAHLFVLHRLFASPNPHFLMHATPIFITVCTLCFNIYTCISLRYMQSAPLFLILIPLFHV